MTNEELASANFMKAAEKHLLQFASSYVPSRQIIDAPINFEKALKSFRDVYGAADARNPRRVAFTATLQGQDELEDPAQSAQSEEPP